MCPHCVQGYIQDTGFTPCPHCNDVGEPVLPIKELMVVSHLVLAWNEFVELEILHQDDQDEFRRAIHAAQRIIMARPIQRFFIQNTPKQENGGK